MKLNSLFFFRSEVFKEAKCGGLFEEISESCNDSFEVVETFVVFCGMIFGENLVVFRVDSDSLDDSLMKL